MQNYKENPDDTKKRTDLTHVDDAEKTQTNSNATSHSNSSYWISCCGLFSKIMNRKGYQTIPDPESQERKSEVRSVTV